MKNKTNFLSEEFNFISTKNELEEFFNNYRTELAFTHGKIEIEQIESAVSYQKAVVEKQDMRRFTIMICLGLLGSEEFNEYNFEKYLSLINVSLSLADFNSLDSEALDA